VSGCQLVLLQMWVCVGQCCQPATPARLTLLTLIILDRLLCCGTSCQVVLEREGGCQPSLPPCSSLNPGQGSTRRRATLAYWCTKTPLQLQMSHHMPPFLNFYLKMQGIGGSLAGSSPVWLPRPIHILDHRDTNWIST
jgi:hypothetical protein